MSWPAKANQIKKLQIELTNYCQARCPECAREKLYAENYKKPDIPYLYELNNSYVTFKQFKSWLGKDEWTGLRLIDFCGNYDEPTTNPDILKIIDWVLGSDNFSKQLVLNIATNGGTRSTKFWTDVANLCKKYRTKGTYSRLRIVWGIDGLEDTNHLYRRNVIWKKVQDNFRAFLSNGGYGYWQFIYFKHNEHQEEEVKQRSIKEGFAGMKWRGGHSRDYNKTKVKPAETGKFETNFGYNHTPKKQIVCKALSRPEYHGHDTGLYVTYHGWVIPCCWWGSQLELGKIYDTYRTDVASHKLNGTNSFQQILDTDWFSNLYEYIQTQESSTCVLHCKQNVLSTISTDDHKINHPENRISTV